MQVAAFAAFSWLSRPGLEQQRAGAAAMCEVLEQRSRHSILVFEEGIPSHGQLLINRRTAHSLQGQTTWGRAERLSAR